MSLFPNNPEIDFGKLTQRVSLEVDKLARRKLAVLTESIHETDGGGNPETANAVPLMDELNGGTALRRSVWRPVLVLLWCGRHFRTILRRAIAAVHAAERAQDGIHELQMRLDRLEELARGGKEQLALVREPTFVHLMAGLDDLRARTRALELASQRIDASMTTLSARVEAVADLQLAFQHGVRFQQRWLMLPAVRSSSSLRLGLPTIGVISTWNSRCGIAAYTQSLLSGIDPARLRVFASEVSQVLRADEGFVRRCWIEGWDDPLDKLFEEVRASHIDALVLQFNFGFFRPAALQRLLDRLHGEGILVFMTLHATMDAELAGMTARLGDIRTSLARVCRLLVHSVHDLNRLKAIGLVGNVALFPMGLPPPFNGDRRAVRRSLGLDGRSIVASFGYLLPNKGLPELIRAFALLRAMRPDAHLLMLNALYPLAASEHERDVCLDEIRLLGIQDSVTLVTDFLDEATLLARLAAADVVVYPYQHTQESASAAVRMGLSSGTAVAVTPLPIFDDIATVSHALPGTAPAEMADGLASLLSDPKRRTALAEQQRNWVCTHQWATLSARLDGLIRGEVDAHINLCVEDIGQRQHAFSQSQGDAQLRMVRGETDRAIVSRDYRSGRA